jgi:hypothetical protein
MCVLQIMSEGGQRNRRKKQSLHVDDKSPQCRQLRKHIENIEGEPPRNGKKKSGATGRQAKEAEKQMERDEEYRRLNARIKEQEYRLRQLDASKRDAEEIEKRLAKKVEEEIVQKLSRAALLSSMYKASQSNPIQNSPKFEPMGSNQPTKNHAETRMEGIGARETLNNPVQVAPVSAKLIKRKQMLDLETNLQRTIEEIRRDKSQLQDFVLLGPANGAPDYSLKCSELEAYFLHDLTCHSLKEEEGVSLVEACENRVCERLWDLRQRQLQLFHLVLSSAAQKGASEKSSNENIISQVG